VITDCGNAGIPPSSFGDNAKLAIAHTPPATLDWGTFVMGSVGTRRTFSIPMKNTGTTTWTDADAICEDYPSDPDFRHCVLRVSIWPKAMRNVTPGKELYVPDGLGGFLLAETGTPAFYPAEPCDTRTWRPTLQTLCTQDIASFPPGTSQQIEIDWQMVRFVGSCTSPFKVSLLVSQQPRGRDMRHVQILRSWRSWLLWPADVLLVL
jgi:hypothetical protein